MADAMGLRRFLIPIVMALGGLFALLALQWKLDLGSFADSPQLLDIPLGARAVAGGGRAGIDFTEVDETQAVLRVWCAQHSSTLHLEPHRTTEEICGVTVRLLGLIAGRPGEARIKAALEVAWDD